LRQGWIVFEPSNTVSPDFLLRVHNATRDQFPGVYSEATTPSAYAADLFDAVLLVNALSRASVDRNADGAQLVRELPSISFDGMSGHVSFDDSGERKTPVRAMNVRQVAAGSWEARPVGLFDPEVGEFVSFPHSLIVWPGGATRVPMDPADVPGSTVNTVWLLVGAGVSALVVVSALLAIVKKRYRALQHILVMLMTELAKLAGSLMMETIDLVTDWISCYQVLHSEGISTSDEYKVAYTMCISLGTLSTLFSIFYRIRNALLVRKHMLKLAMLNSRDVNSGKDDRKRQAQSYEWELLQSHRSLVTCGVEILTSVVQGIPMAIMNSVLILGQGVNDRMVVASLMVSVLLLGKKTTLGAQIVRTVNRRKELHRNLELLMYHLEEEDLQDWLHAVAKDQEDRDQKVRSLQSSTEQYTPLEIATITAGLGTLGGMSSAVGKINRKHGDTVELAYTRFDKESNRLIGEVRAVIRGASPELLTAYMMNPVSSHNKLLVQAITTRMEILEQISVHHAIFFNEKTTKPFTNRTFLARLICKRISDATASAPASALPRSLAEANSARTWVFVTAPCAHHDSLKPEDEEGSVRAEAWRTCRFTALNESETLMEFAVI
jgi:hypothetical protein